MPNTVCKLVGAAAVLLSAVLWGIFKIRAERRKTAELEALCSLVSFIGDNIAHFCRPLPEIYADFHAEALDGCGFTELLRRDGMTEAVRALSLGEKSEAEREINLFASRLGMGYKQEQTELCAYTFGRLKGLLDEREKNGRDKEKLYRTLPILFALSVILMFI